MSELLRKIREVEVRLAHAKKVQGKRVQDTSKNNYFGKLNTIKVYLRGHNCGHLIDENNDIIVPLDYQEVLAPLFSWLSTNTELPKRKSWRKRHEETELSVASDAVAATPSAAAVAEDIEVEDESDDSDDEYQLHHQAILNGDAQECTVFGPADAEDSFIVDEADNEITVSASCMQGYKSALMWWYRQKNVIMDPKVEQMLDDFIMGYKNIISNKKSRGVMKITEGKYPLSYTGFNSIALHFMQLTPEKRGQSYMESIFGWSFFVLSWNLLARSENVSKLMLEHMNWANDCLCIKFPRSKGSPDGQREGIKHIYANPFNFKICPITALGVYVFSVTWKPKENKLFPGQQQEKRFLKLLKHIIESVYDTGVDLGAAIKDLGSHSGRKGSISYLLSLCHCINAVMVYLRAGWSLGAVQDRYIFAGPGGDQLCGRAICGLSLTTREFTVLPPHFSKTDTEALFKVGWNNIIDNYSTLPATFQRIVPFLLSSVLYHEKALRESLSPHHPLWLSTIFTRKYDLPDLENLPETKMQTLSEYFVDHNRIIVCFGKCDDTSMEATGIPEHLVIANELHDMQDTVKALGIDLKQTIKNMQQSLEFSISKVPVMLYEMLRRDFDITGLQPVTRHDLDNQADIMYNRISNLLTPLRQSVETLINKERSAAAATATADGSMTVGHIRENSNFRTFMYNGRFYVVPEDFEFPSCNTKKLFDVWWFGDEAKGVLPYRFLQKYRDDLHKKPSIEKSKLVKATAVMNAIQLLMERKLSKAMESFTREECTSNFDAAFDELTSKLYETKKRKARPEQKCYTTIANHLFEYLSIQKTL